MRTRLNPTTPTALRERKRMKSRTEEDGDRDEKKVKGNNNRHHPEKNPADGDVCVFTQVCPVGLLLSTFSTSVCLSLLVSLRRCACHMCRP